MCFLANVGQEEDYAAVEKKALALGAEHMVIEDLQREFVEEIVFRAVQCNAIYEDRYLLGTSLARPVIARAQVRVAQQYNCDYLSHGCTGKGVSDSQLDALLMPVNVVHRTSMYMLHGCSQEWPTDLNPQPSPLRAGLQGLQPLTQSHRSLENARVHSEVPVRTFAMVPDTLFYTNSGLCRGRADLLKFAAENNIPVSSTPKAPWSMDDNLVHCSYEAGVLEDPDHTPPKELWTRTVDPTDAPDKPYEFTIYFEKGIPVKVVTPDQTATDSVELFKLLNKIGHDNGVGRVDIVENRFIGLKSRGRLPILHSAIKMPCS